MEEKGTFIFKACNPKPWLGRYGRIYGNSDVFTVKYDYERRALWPYAVWNFFSEDLSCPAFNNSPYIYHLVEAINRAKSIMYASIPGGSFVINEYGQVIVPSSRGDGRRMLAGQIEGKLLFVNPLDNSIIDLCDDKNLQIGDVWNKPYIGVVYNLHRNSFIYYLDKINKMTVYPSVQDEELVRKLRHIRRYGPVRFIVTYRGIVLTKIGQGDYWKSDNKWQAVYVGRINYNKWFKKEE